jgi:[acyl-carrier-protein] S-malonyltransferase
LKKMKNIEKIAFIFPGQGSQSLGMGKSLSESFKVASDTLVEGSDALGLDLKKLCFDGPKEVLDSTENTQPALLAVSVAALRVLDTELGLSPKLVAGHSLGEYSALVSASVLNFGDALRLVKKRGEFMQSAVAPGEGAMCAVLGLSAEEVQDICTKATETEKNEVVVAANINSPAQIVISGTKPAVERAALIAKEKGAKRVLPLPVSVPSHSPLMKKAAELLKQELETFEFSDFKIPLISNVEAKLIEDKDRVSELLTLQLTSPVRWVETINCMKEHGVRAAIELGSGKVLSGLIKRTEKEIITLNLGEASELSKVESQLSALE